MSEQKTSPLVAEAQLGAARRQFIRDHGVGANIVPDVDSNSKANTTRLNPTEIDIRNTLARGLQTKKIGR